MAGYLLGDVQHPGAVDGNQHPIGVVDLLDACVWAADGCQCSIHGAWRLYSRVAYAQYLDAVCSRAAGGRAASRAGCIDDRPTDTAPVTRLPRPCYVPFSRE